MSWYEVFGGSSRVGAGQHPLRQLVSTAEQVEPGRAGVDVLPGETERVVVVPEGARPLVVGVLEGGRARRPAQPGPFGEPGPELAVRAAGHGHVGWEVPGHRQVPRLGVSVALLGAVRAVQMHHLGHRASIPLRAAVPPPVAVPVRDATGRVGPVQGGVHRQQVRQVVTPVVDELVDPGHPHRAAHPGHDGGRGVAEAAGVGGGAVTPHGGARPRRRQDLLAKLSYRDLVRVALRIGGHRRHGRGDPQRGDVLRDVPGLQRRRGERPTRRRPTRRDQRHRAAGGTRREQPTSGDHAAPPIPPDLV